MDQVHRGRYFVADAGKTRAIGEIPHRGNAHVFGYRRLPQKEASSFFPGGIAARNADATFIGAVLNDVDQALGGPLRTSSPSQIKPNATIPFVESLCGQPHTVSELRAPELFGLK